MTINYIAVIVAAVAGFLFGWVWYGPLFGKQWMKLSGMTHENMKSMKMSPAQSMTFGFITTLITAGALDYFVMRLNVADIWGALCLALVVWLGFYATTMAGSVLWEDKSPKLYCFNVLYHLISLGIMTAVIFLFS